MKHTKLISSLILIIGLLIWLVICLTCLFTGCRRNSLRIKETDTIVIQETEPAETIAAIIEDTVEAETVIESTTELPETTEYIVPVTTTKQVVKPVTTTVVTTIPETTIPETQSITETVIAEETSNISSTYIGYMKVTGYTHEEGFKQGSATASGIGCREGICAMNNTRRKELGIKYGDTIYVEGLGTYQVYDCGCSYNTIDIWFWTNKEAYAITGYYNVYRVIN